jgi:predicted patatin/cPLA2 family phospholipase
MIENIGLVLEGGGMRGVFTSGILDFFMEKGIWFRNVYGVSAGACNGISYAAKQIGRNKKVNCDFCADPRYASFRNFIKEKSIFGMNFIFDEIPKNQVPLDYDTYYASEMNLKIGVTSLLTGKAEYFPKNISVENTAIIKASCSMPIVSPICLINGKPYLDGGVADPIPFERSQLEGNKKNLIILTRDTTYQKEASSTVNRAARIRYCRYPNFIKVLESRHEHYNNQLEKIRKMEKEGSALVFRPSEPVRLKKFEHDVSKLEKLYQEGYEQATDRLKEIQNFLKLG